MTEQSRTDSEPSPAAETDEQSPETTGQVLTETPAPEDPLGEDLPETDPADSDADEHPALADAAASASGSEIPEPSHDSDQESSAQSGQSAALARLKAKAPHASPDLSGTGNETPADSASAEASDRGVEQSRGTPQDDVASHPGTAKDSPAPSAEPASAVAGTPQDISSSGATDEETESQNTSRQDTSSLGLSGFLDSLDERARDWWKNRKQRRAQRQADKDAAAQQHDADAPAPQVDETPAGSQPAAEEPAGERPSWSSGPGGFPIAGVPSRHTDTSAPHAQSPSSAPSKNALPEVPSEDATQVLPPIRDLTGPISLPRPPAETRAPARPRAPHAPSAGSPMGPPRVRRALDDQRRRDVILEKAAAIEAATAGNHRPPAYEFADDEEDLYTYIPPYNLPSRDPDPEPTQIDFYRRIFVSVGAAAALASLLWMLGLFGTSPAVLTGNGLEEHSDGWFSGEYALLSPDHNMYWLWPVLVVGLVAHAVFQWMPTQQSTPRQQRSGWLVGASSLLMLVVTAAVHFGLFTLNLLASMAVALALVDAIRQFNLYTARTTLERRLTDAIVGAFFGFALVQAMSALSVWLTYYGWHIPGIPALLWALLGLFICVWTAAFYSMTERGRITISLALGWGMFWLIFPRLLAEVTSVWVAIGAAMGAFIVILSTQSRRHRINHAERRAAMGRPLEDII
ncbi:hypothetical protein [Nesterenkonia flava]|uniref:Uncharacterized protein n=1 Tax=Nesterenkonia flava TaxID=469799 RepID=A0ABU1FQU1_9MICC|nr:hypothetical protein [Nesterenkonia flava]MDR5711021.1 hypothetical protein [Nesterenkonia flava]